MISSTARALARALHAIGGSRVARGCRACRKRGIRSICAIAPGLDLAAARAKRPPLSSPNSIRSARLGASTARFSGTICPPDCPRKTGGCTAPWPPPNAPWPIAWPTATPNRTPPHPGCSSIPPSTGARQGVRPPISLPSGGGRETPTGHRVPLDRSAHCLRGRFRRARFARCVRSLDANRFSGTISTPTIMTAKALSGSVHGACPCTAAGDRRGVAESQPPVRNEFRPHPHPGCLVPARACRAPHSAKRRRPGCPPSPVAEARLPRSTRSACLPISSISRARMRGIVPGPTWPT